LARLVSLDRIYKILQDEHDDSSEAHFWKLNAGNSPQ